MNLLVWTANLRTLWDRVRANGAPLRPEAVRELAGKLEREKRLLNAFTGSLEQEFLQLGALLRKIASLARDIRDRSGQIVEAAAGRTEGAAIQFAFQLLKKAEDLVQASREQHANLFHVFEAMRVDLIRIARERETLIRTLMPLESTNTQFRIQACAFDATTREQFFALAEAIAGIVRDFQSAVGDRFEELDRAGRATGDLVNGLTALAEEQKKETDRMLVESRAHLASLNEALSTSERSAVSLSEAGANIAIGVSNVIVALQCQDMAQQKFQHIGAAIDEMIGHLSGASVNGMNREDRDDCRRFLAGAGRVQLAQLQAVFEQLDVAARQVDAGLVEVETEARSLAGHAVRSAGAALQGRVIERAIDSIHAVLEVINKAVTTIRSVVDMIANLKSMFTDCTSQILTLAVRLRTAALNAQIFAARVDEGAALEVVAGNTRAIADDAMQRLDEISVRLTGMVDSVIDLEQRLGDYSELAAMEQKVLSSEAADSEKKLHALRRELRESVTSIAPLEQQLSQNIRQAIHSIRFPAAAADAGARSMSLFRDIATQQPDSDAASHDKVQDLKRNYTMAHERDVHESSLEHAAANSAPEREVQTSVQDTHEESEHSDEAAGSESGEQLAGNIELF